MNQMNDHPPSHHTVENFFPNELKDGDVSALFKNSDSFHKKNYGPMAVLPSVSKVFERLLINQMLPFVNDFLSE